MVGPFAEFADGHGVLGRDFFGGGVGVEEVGEDGVDLGGGDGSGGDRAAIGRSRVEWRGWRRAGAWRGRGGEWERG